MRPKTTVRRPSFTVSETGGVFDTAWSPSGTTTVSWYGILNAGSSQQGKACRASSASNCVKRYDSSPTTTL